MEIDYLLLVSFDRVVFDQYPCPLWKTRVVCHLPEHSLLESNEFGMERMFHFVDEQDLPKEIELFYFFHLNPRWR